MKLKNGKKKIKGKDLKYGTKKYTYDFRKSETKRPFGETTCIHTYKIVEVEEDQNNLLKN